MPTQLKTRGWPGNVISSGAIAKSRNLFLATLMSDAITREDVPYAGHPIVVVAGFLVLVMAVATFVASGQLRPGLLEVCVGAVTGGLFSWPYSLLQLRALKRRALAAREDPSIGLTSLFFGISTGANGVIAALVCLVLLLVGGCLVYVQMHTIWVLIPGLARPIAAFESCGAHGVEWPMESYTSAMMVYAVAFAAFTGLRLVSWYYKLPSSQPPTANGQQPTTSREDMHNE